MSANSCPNFKTSISAFLLVSVASQLPQFVYVKLPTINSGAPKLLADFTSPKNKTSHSTVRKLVNSFALEDVTSCTCVTKLPAGHTSCAPGPGSELHSDVDSAIAEEAPNAITISAAVAARPSILISFTLFSLPGRRTRRDRIAPGFPDWRTYTTMHKEGKAFGAIWARSAGSCVSIPLVSPANARTTKYRVRESVHSLSRACAACRKEPKL